MKEEFITKLDKDERILFHGFSDVSKTSKQYFRFLLALLVLLLFFILNIIVIKIFGATIEIVISFIILCILTISLLYGLIYNIFLKHVNKNNEYFVTNKKIALYNSKNGFKMGNISNIEHIGIVREKKNYGDLIFNFYANNLIEQIKNMHGNVLGIGITDSKVLKSIDENNNIVNRFARKTKRLSEYIIDQLRDLQPVSAISKNTTVDPGYISRMFPYLAVTNTHLPRVLCIDEFKGNAGKYKYQVALIDGETHEVIDILECRYKHFLCDYFKKFPKSQLDNVKYFVNAHLRIDGNSKKIMIGKDCMFSYGINIWTGDGHPIYDLTTGERINEDQDVIIGNHVWMGRNVSVHKGGVIPDGCVIGANSFVTKKFEEPNCIIAGTPAKIIKKNIRWEF